MPKKNRPPKKLLDEVQAVFEKHNWDGFAVAAKAASPQELICPVGQTPHDITYQLPDGTWVTKTVCL